VGVGLPGVGEGGAERDGLADWKTPPAMGVIVTVGAFATVTPKLP
jgi:hypothetical protein